MKILLATDGSESARAALDFLLGFPFPEGSEAIVVSVIDWNALSVEQGFSEEQTRSIREARGLIERETQEFLDTEGERLRSAGWTGATELRHGDPADEIIRAVEEHGADLVVLGSHGTAGVKRFLLGSVSDRVLQYAPCSVLITRQPGEGQAAPLHAPPWRILLAYDNSAPSKKALALCASLPLDDRAEVSVVRVMALVTAYRQDIRQHLNTIWQEKKQAAKAALEKAVAELRWSTSHVSAELHESADVSGEILDIAEKSAADLVMVGSKGKSAIQRFLLGSCTNRVARHAHCSVWTVRE